MILGIGTDLVRIGRIRRELDRPGEGLISRTFTRRERQQCMTGEDPAPLLAGRWAAKEAVLKALGTGYSRAIAWEDVEVLTDGPGSWTVRLGGRARAIARSLGSTGLRVTMAHEGDLATAVAILESTAGAGESPPGELG